MSCRERPQENFKAHLVAIIRLILLSYVQYKEEHAFFFFLLSYNYNAYGNYKRAATFECRHPVTVLLTTKETQIGVFTSVPQRK